MIIIQICFAVLTVLAVIYFIKKSFWKRYYFVGLIRVDGNGNYATWVWAVVHAKPSKVEEEVQKILAQQRGDFHIKSINQIVKL